MNSDTRYLKGLSALVLILSILAFSEYLLIFDLILVAFWFLYIKQYRALQGIRILRSITPQRLFENEIGRAHV